MSEACKGLYRQKGRIAHERGHFFHLCPPPPVVIVASWPGRHAGIASRNLGIDFSAPTAPLFFSHTIFSGWTQASYCSAVRIPRAKAASFRVVFSW